MISSFFTGPVEFRRRAPTAVVGSEPAYGVLGSVIRLNGFHSTDPDGNELTYAWAFHSTPIGSSVRQEGFRKLNQDDAEVSFSPDIVGEYVVQLTVSNGLYADSTTTKVSIRSILVPHGRGIVPDGKFIWSYIRDVWQHVEGRELFETFWSALLQIAGSELLKTYQVDANKSIRDIQDLYQRRWLCYEPKLSLVESDLTFILGEHLAGTSASTTQLGLEGKAVIISQNEVVVVRGSILASVYGEQFSILYSKDDENVGTYGVTGQNSSKNGYVLDRTIANPTKDKLTSNPIPVLFDFQSVSWKFWGSPQADYALLLSQFASPTDQITDIMGTGGSGGSIVPDLRVGDVVRFAAGRNAGYYVITQVAGADFTVDHAPPSSSELGSPYLVDVYRPVGFVLTQPAKPTTDIFDIPYKESEEVLTLTSDRIITLNGQAYMLLRSFLDPNQMTPLTIVTTDGGTIPAGQNGLAWRVPYTLHSASQNFDELGVSPGDLLLIDVTNENSGTFSEVVAQVVGVAGRRLGFVLTDEPLVAGQPFEVPDKTYLKLSQDLGIGTVTAVPNGVSITGDFKTIVDFLNSGNFKKEYWNRPLTTSTVFNILGGEFKVRPKTIIRNTRVPVPDLVRSIPVLQEYVAQPTVSEHDGRVFMVRGQEEVEIPRLPVALIENADFIIDNDNVFEGEMQVSTGSVMVDAEAGEFVGRNLCPGDYFEILYPPELSKPYIITDVIGQSRLRLNLPIPQPASTRDPYTQCLVRIRRRLKGHFVRMLPGGFTAKSPAPERLWAEVSFFDNAETIENNFGLLVGLKKADLDSISKDINYRQAVAGLMFAYTRGPEVDKVRLGAQILLGLPFSEHEGEVRSIENDYRIDQNGNPTLGRILVEDTDVDGVKTGTLRVYTYPIDNASTDFSGVETNPLTKKAYVVGDRVGLFVALAKGVEIIDYRSKPLSSWATAQQKLRQFHSFRLRANDNIFSLAEMGLVSSFLRKITPSYITYTILTVSEVSDQVRVTDYARLRAMFVGDSAMVDNISTGLPNALIFDLRTMFGREYGFWDDGFPTMRKLGIGTTAERVNPLPAPEAVKVTLPSGGFVTPQAGEAPVVAPGDRIQLYSGWNKGTYTVASVTDTEVTLADAPEGGFEADAEVYFAIFRLTKPELRRGTATLAEVGQTVVVEPGLRSDGVMPGDLFLVQEGGSVSKHFITSVVESTPGSDVWDTLTVTPPPLSIGSWPYRIFRPAALPTPYLGDSALLHSDGTKFDSIDNPFLLALMEAGDELVVNGGDFPRLLVQGPRNLSFSPTLPVGSYEIHLAKRMGPTGGQAFDFLRYHPWDVVSLSLVANPSLAVSCVSGDPVVELGDGFTTPKPGDHLVFSSGIGATVDHGYGPGVYPIVEVRPIVKSVVLAYAPGTTESVNWKIMRVLPPL